MTKKSLGRQQRDAKQKQEREAVKAFKNSTKNNTCWNDVAEACESCFGMLAAHYELVKVSQNKELLDAVADKPLLVTNIRQLTNDIRQMSDELTKIKESIGERTGGTEDPNEFILSLQIFEQLNLFMERHQAVIIPTSMYISEQLDAAQLILEQQKQSQSNEVVVTSEDPVAVPLTERNIDVVDAVVIQQS